MFRLISKYVKEASILIIILSLAKQFLYFNRFNVPINYFFSFSEIWLLLTDDMFFLIFILVLFLMGFSVLKKQENSGIVPNGLKLSKGEKIVDIIFKSIMLLLISFSIIRIFTVPIYTTKINLSIVVSLIVCISFIFWWPKQKYFNSTGLVLLGLIMILSIVGLRTSFKIDSVVNGKYKGTIIKTADTTYFSNDTSFFIGKTERYFFIYNVKDESTDIIPSELVIKVKLRSK